MLIRTIALTAALALAGGSAFAQGLIQANLQSSLASPAAPIAGETQFACQGSTCAAQVDPDSNAYTDAFSVIACEQLVKSVGPVSAYTRDGKTFTSSQLDHCNAAAPKGSGVQTAAAH